MKRQLTAEEKNISQKSLKAMKDKQDYNNYQIEICDLKLKKGLEIEYLKNVNDYKRLKKEFEDELIVIKSKINTLQDQIRNGVEIKEDKVEKEVAKDE